jgi:hypothetical protein
MLPSDIGWIGSLIRVAAMPVAYRAGRPLAIHGACTRGADFRLPTLRVAYLRPAFCAPHMRVGRPLVRFELRRPPFASHGRQRMHGLRARRRWPSGGYIEKFSARMS